jgi:hypothetical protein
MVSLLGLVVLVLDIVAIVNIVQSAMATDKKVLWVLLVALLPVIGMVMYFVIGKKNG